MGLLRLKLILLSGFCVCLLRPASSQVSFTPETAILFPGDNVTFTCNDTNKLWLINDTATRKDDLELQQIDGISSGGPGFTMLIITQSANNTLYGCGIISGGRFVTDTGIVYVATAPNQVPDVTVDVDTITLNDNIVTLTLSWGEPFNNFDPILSYTVSCSGDNVTCPANFTTTDNTTRSYTITNLTSITNYTFSVVATNSIDNGEAGVEMITAPSVPGNITGLMLVCEVNQMMDQNNQCTVDWDPITVGNGPLEQPLVYEVYYNGTMINVNSSTTTLTFTAPSLPDGVFVGNITVIVTAINRFGRGTPSDPEYDEIMSSSVTNAEVTMTTPEDATNTTYSITVTCTIHPDSTADQCVVMATANGQTLTGNAPIPIGETTVDVTINGIACGVTYTIIAGGTFDGDLVGPRSSHGTDTAGPCPPSITPTTVPTSSMTASTDPAILPTTTVIVPPDVGESSSDNTGAIAGGSVGGILAAIIIIIIIILVVWCCIKREKSSRPTSPGDKVGFRPASGVKVQTLDRYGKPVPSEQDNTDTGVELTGYTSKSPEFTVATSTGQPSTFQSNDYQTAPSDEKNRTPSAFLPEGSYDTLAPADEPQAPSAQVIPPAQNGQSNPNAPKLNYAELEQFTRKPASVKKPEPQPSSQYAVIDPKSLQPGTYT